MSKQADSLGFEQDAKPENVVWHRHAVDKAQRATL
ncbi:adenylyl-sulfate kinase, partial [Vibrio sp. NO3-D2]|nr:adenylyl-sulfate kinase [Vibrio sp. NO3-D2]